MGNSGQHERRRSHPSIRAIWHIGFFLVGVVLAHAIGFVAAIVLGVTTRTVPPRVSFIPLTAVLLLVVSRLATRKLEGASPKALGLSFDRRWILHSIAGMLAGGALVTVVWVVLSALGLAESSLNLGTKHQIPRLMIGFVFCAGIALQEELLFRGFVFQLIGRRNLKLAVILCGLAFVAIHIPNDGGTHLPAMLNCFLAHLFFSACYLRTRSLWLPVALHTMWNYSEGFLLGMPFWGQNLGSALATTELTQSVWSGYAFGADGGLVVTGIFLMASAVVWRFVPQNRPADDLMTTPALPAPETRAVEPAEPFVRRLRAERILTIDVLRGTALLGILPMNMQIFAFVPGGVVYPYATDFSDPANVTAWVALRVLFGSKDLSMFSMLFGAGLILMSGARREADESLTRIHLRRMAALFAFGMIHAYAIWAGDILVTYAIVGTIVFWMRNLNPRLLITIGACAYAVPMALLLAAHFLLPMLGGNVIEAIVAQINPPPEAAAEYYAGYASGWIGQMKVRAVSALSNQTIGLVGAIGWIAGGMMLIGMGLQRLGVLSGERRTRDYVPMIAAAALLGFPLLGLSFLWNFAHDWALPGGFFLGWCMREVSYAIIVFGWIGAVAILCKHLKLAWFTAPLAAVGKLSMTNYLMQSIICSFIFYGHGLGLIGQLGNITQIYITLGIWTIQIVASTLWMQRFRYGPAEWLWRSLVEMEWQRWR